MSDQKKISNHYQNLIKMINHHNLLYHTYDSPSISDDEYDKLYRELKKIEKNDPSLISLDSPSQRVGSILLEQFDKKKHDTPMLSLSNCFSKNDFIDFYKKTLSSTKSQQIKFFAEPKFDGLAVNITYKNGVYQSATTRGDGFIGEDVTQNVKTIKSLPIIIDNTDLPKTFSLRGEIFIDKADFNSINKELLSDNLKVYSNPRNLAAGSIRQLDPSIASSRKLRLFIHGIADPDKFKKFKDHAELISHLSEIGFPVNRYSETMNSIDECFEYYERMVMLRDKIPYEIDGLVYRVSDFAICNMLGYTTKSPKWAIAYKFKSLEVLTQVKTVTFQVGRTGTITPVAELTPVNIGGVRVTRATLHNFSEIKSKDIHINDYVYVKRAGDVIPDIDRVDHSKRKKAIKIIPPKRCPSCNSILRQIDNQVAYKCYNSKNCKPQIEQSIIHFISRKAMNIQGIGIQLIKELVSKKIISGSSDLFKLNQDDFKKLNRVGAKSISNYLSSINNSKKVNFSKFIYSLGIKEVGEASSKALAYAFNNINELIKCKYEKLVSINDVGPIVAKNIISFFEDEDNKKNIIKLIRHGVDIIYDQKTFVNTKTVVITGTFSDFTRTRLTEVFEENGYSVSGSISKNTDILVCGEKPGSKLKKAQNLGIEVIYERDLIKLLSKFH